MLSWKELGWTSDSSLGGLEVISLEVWTDNGVDMGNGTDAVYNRIGRLIGVDTEGS